MDGVFLSCRTSFIITDDMKVAVNSMGLVLNVLNDLGYSGFDKLQEMVIDIGLEKVLCDLSLPFHLLDKCSWIFYWLFFTCRF